MVFWPTTVRAFSRPTAVLGCPKALPKWKKKISKKKQKQLEKQSLASAWEDLVESWSPKPSYGPRPKSRPEVSAAHHNPSVISESGQCEDKRPKKLPSIDVTETPSRHVPSTLTEEAIRFVSTSLTPPRRDPPPHSDKSPRVPIKPSSERLTRSRRASPRRVDDDSSNIRLLKRVPSSRSPEDNTTRQKPSKPPYYDSLQPRPELRLSRVSSHHNNQHRANVTLADRLRLIQEKGVDTQVTKSLSNLQDKETMQDHKPPNPQLGIKALDAFLERGGIRPPPRLDPPDLSEIVKGSQSLVGRPLRHRRPGMDNKGLGGKRSKAHEPQEQEQKPEVPWQRPNMFFPPRAPEVLHMEQGFKLNAIHARYRSFLSHPDVRTVVDLGAGDGSWSNFVAYKLARNFDPDGGLSPNSRLRGMELEGMTKDRPPHEENGDVVDAEEVSLEGLFDPPESAKDTIVAVDVREMPFLNGMHRVQGDIMDDATIRLIDEALRAESSSSRMLVTEDLGADAEGEIEKQPETPPKVDVVLSDLVPDNTDDHLKDVEMSLKLCRRGWEFAKSRLKSVDEVGRPKAGVLLMRHIPHPLLTTFRLAVLEPCFEIVKYINPRVEQGIVDVNEDGEVDDDVGSYFICLGFKGAKNESQRVWHKHVGPGINSYLIK